MRLGCVLMQEPSIGVIVPNYNDTRHLSRCLRSVLEQPDGPQELIIMDDHSTDDSVALIRSLTAGDARAQLFLNPANLGTNKTIAEGLRRARSDYVVCLAANDFLLPGMFARARQALAQAPGAGLWSAMAWLVDEDDKLIRLHPSAVVSLADAYLPPEKCAKLAYRLGNWFTGTTAIYHRETLISIGGFNPRYGAPADLFAALTVSGMKGAVFTPEPFAAIRIHENSYSSRALGDVAGIENMLDELRQHAPRLAPSMFTPRMLERTKLRFRFACVRATAGTAIPEVAKRVETGRRLGLQLLQAILPSTISKVRVALAFLILRPFDILPTLWYRLLGWMFVRLRLKPEAGRS